MCNEIDLVQCSENLNEPPSAQNIEVYRNLSEEATKFTTGEYYMFGLRCIQSHSQISHQGRRQNMDALYYNEISWWRRGHMSYNPFPLCLVLLAFVLIMRYM